MARPRTSPQPEVPGLAARRIAADILDNKLEMAKTFGATHTINTGTNEDAVKKVKEITGGKGTRPTGA